MKIGWTTQPLDRIRVDAVLVPAVEGAEDLGAPFRELDRALGGALTRALEGSRFAGKACHTLVVPAPEPTKARRIVLVGVGKNERIPPQRIRRAFTRAVRALGPGEHTVATCLPPGEPAAALGAAVEGLNLGSYSFLRHRSRVDDPPASITRLTITHAKRTRALEHAVGEAQVLSEATCFARDLVNEPPGHSTPTLLAKSARKMAKEVGLSAKVLGRAEMERRHMGALLGVSAGTREEPKLIHLDYKPSGRAKTTVVLVGKGITFDSGGLSLKPPPAMMTMKCDMGGGAAVIGAMQAIARLKPRVRVHGIVPAAENMPGPGATRPGDVHKTASGKTVEILNTDAEGRLILADALEYASGLGADSIVDLATLTGACVVALGEQIAAVYARDRALAGELLDAAEAEGEPLWEMPLFPGYRKELKSEVADLKNIGGRMGGSITAALFLSEFVKAERWAHLDIAGPAFSESPTELGPKGATGYGVRTIVRWILSL